MQKREFGELGGSRYIRFLKKIALEDKAEPEYFAVVDSENFECDDGHFEYITISNDTTNPNCDAMALFSINGEEIMLWNNKFWMLDKYHNFPDFPFEQYASYKLMVYEV